MSESPNQSDYRPSASFEVLKLRARMLAALREFFDSTGYIEVETPILSHDIVVDANLEPFVTESSSGQLFLQTSPEFGMKRLLVDGAESIYQITRAFRRDEIGRYHNPEFTIVEWYRVGDNHHAQMEFVEQLVESIRDKFATNHEPASDSERYQRLTYDTAFERFVGTRVLELNAAELIQLAKEKELLIPASLPHDDRDGLLNFLLAELVEPNLGIGLPCFVYDYPATQAALAKIREDVPPVAERFELYWQGVELCNGYHELTDPDELERRSIQQSRIRDARQAQPLPIQNRLLSAMRAGLPPCAGVALGFDRLLMLCIGASSLADVMAFPIDRA